MELKAIHNKHLKDYGVKLPREGSNKQIQLIVLYEAYRADPSKLIHKDAVSAVVRSINSEAATDQQVRHLQADGWNIENKFGKHRFLDPTRPSPTIVKEATKRLSLMSAEGFLEIKAAWHNCCATCGSKEGEKSWRYSDIVKLQKGHKDPEKPEVNENIIPQCQYCNQTYKSDFTFDDKGRVRAVADIGPVQRASKSVKQKIKEHLMDS